MVINVFIQICIHREGGRVLDEGWGDGPLWRTPNLLK